MRLLIIFLLLTSSVYADQSVKVITGYGYLLDKNNNIYIKTEYKKGLARIPNGFTYKEVNNENELNSIKVNRPDLEYKDLEDTMIIENSLALSIKDLFNRGKITKEREDYLLNHLRVKGIL